MKKKFILFLVFNSSLVFSQVGIGTDSPKATLDVNLSSQYVNGSQAGVAFPMLTGNQIEAMSVTDLKAGTLIYATSASTATIKDVDSAGYWYWSGDATRKWEPLFLNHKTVVSYFYAPSIVLPTSPSGVSTSSSDDIYYSSDIYTVNLYAIYNKQYSMAGNVTGVNRTAIKNASAVSLPTLSSTDLDYFITYFDNTVFDPQSITISNDGILTYKVLSNAVVTENTYMNIVYRVK